jgi:uncharacterized membrane protein YidH (DUF202 family)
MRLFDYVYYRIYEVFKRNKDLSPQLAASILLSLIQFLFLVDVLVWLDYFIQFDKETFRYLIYALMIALSIYNWNRYERSHYYKELESKYSKEKIGNSLPLGILIVVTVVLLFIILVVYTEVR